MEINGSDKKDIGKVSRYWDEHVKLHGESSVSVNWLESPLVHDCCFKNLQVGNKLLSISQWVLWVKEKYVPYRLNYGLSLGCGDGPLERQAILSNICSKLTSIGILKSYHV